jgi:DNA-binding transcriptional MerR regulator
VGAQRSAPPGIDADDGYRAYDRDDLVRLQRVLLLRGLGAPDDGLAAALERPADPEAALRMHLDALETLRERLDRQAAALRATLEGRAVGWPADISALFDGFADPEPASPDELADLAVAWARLWASGEPVDGAAARGLAQQHRALSGTEVSPRVAEVLDHHGPGTAAYARDALALG